MKFLGQRQKRTEAIRMHAHSEAFRENNPATFRVQQTVATQRA